MTDRIRPENNYKMNKGELKMLNHRLNKKMNLRVLLFFGVLLCFTQLALALDKSSEEIENKQTLAQFFEVELNTVDTNLKSLSSDSSDTSDSSLITNSGSDEAYFFRRFWLRLRPRVERDIPWLAGFSVIPELEMLFERQAPEGWEQFKIVKNHK